LEYPQVRPKANTPKVPQLCGSWRQETQMRWTGQKKDSLLTTSPETILLLTVGVKNRIEKEKPLQGLWEETKGNFSSILEVVRRRGERETWWPHVWESKGRVRPPQAKPVGLPERAQGGNGQPSCQATTGCLRQKIKGSAACDGSVGRGGGWTTSLSRANVDPPEWESEEEKTGVHVFHDSGGEQVRRGKLIFHYQLYRFSEKKAKKRGKPQKNPDCYNEKPGVGEVPLEKGRDTFEKTHRLVGAG